MDGCRIVRAEEVCGLAGTDSFFRGEIRARTGCDQPYLTASIPLAWKFQVRFVSERGDANFFGRFTKNLQ